MIKKRTNFGRKNHALGDESSLNIEQACAGSENGWQDGRSGKGMNAHDAVIE